VTATYVAARRFWQSRLAELGHIQPEVRPRKPRRRPAKRLTWRTTGIDPLGRTIVAITGPPAYRHIEHLPPALFDDDRVFEAWAQHHTDNYRGAR
jgi:hypothetical protein